MALNDEDQTEVLTKIRQTHRVVTEAIPDERATVRLDMGSALRRLLILARRAEAREMRLVAAVEALAANQGSAKAEILAAVNAALDAVAELDDDLPEGEEPVPVLDTITPNEGPAAGGTAVTLAGTGFAGATGFTVGGAAATEFVVVSSAAITGTVPAGTGVVDVIVQHPLGDATLENGFTYTA